MLAYGVPDTETAWTEIVMCTLVVYMMCSVVCKEKKCYQIATAVELIFSVC